MIENVSPDGLLARSALLRERDEPNDSGSTARHLELAAERIGTLQSALYRLEQAERLYRQMHDHMGDGSMAAGRAWDHMRRCGDQARGLLAESALKPDEWTK